VAHGELTLRQVDVGASSKGNARLQLTADVAQPDVTVNKTRAGLSASFETPVTLRAGDELEITTRGA
jgi:hypothetical protein